MKKSTKKSSKYEPTIADVLEAVQTGFSKVDERFDQVDERFNRIERRTGSLESTVEDMKNTLDGVARAIDKDAVTILDHERRIRYLEKTRA